MRTPPRMFFGVSLAVCCLMASESGAQDVARDLGTSASFAAHFYKADAVPSSSVDFESVTPVQDFRKDVRVMARRVDRAPRTSYAYAWSYRNVWGQNPFAPNYGLGWAGWSGWTGAGPQYLQQAVAGRLTFEFDTKSSGRLIWLGPWSSYGRPVPNYRGAKGGPHELLLER